MKVKITANNPKDKKAAKILTYLMREDYKKLKKSGEWDKVMNEALKFELTYGRPFDFQKYWQERMNNKIENYPNP